MDDVESASFFDEIDDSFDIISAIRNTVNETELDLSSKGLHDVPAAIGQLTLLSDLCLDANRLTNLPDGILRLKALQTLSLQQNLLTALPSEIGQLAALKNLFLDFNQLTDLPDGIGQLKELLFLSLTCNEFTTLPAPIGQLTALMELHLCQNPFDMAALPAIIGTLPCKTLQTLKITYCTFETLPATIGRLTALEILTLEYNELATLPDEIGELTALTQFDINNNQLTKLPATIGQLTSLETLSLNDNQLTALPDEICELIALESLDLTNNQLTALPAAIGQLTLLKRLELAENKLTTLPAAIGQLTALEILALAENQLITLPDEIGTLDALTALILGNNKLTTLPPTIGQLTALTELYLNYNQLHTIPTTIGRLQNLSELYLNGNQLDALPATIGQLQSLRLLNLYHNKLTTLPATIGRLTKLESLDLHSNELVSLPATIGQLTVLTDLNVDYNHQLDSIPAAIGQLTALTELGLCGNSLTTLPSEIGKLIALTQLRVNNNQLTTLPNEIGKLIALTQLCVNNNQLTTLPNEIGKLIALTQLRVNNNQLTTLPNEIGKLIALAQLDLSNNQLTTIPSSLHQLLRLSYCSLSGNFGLLYPPPEITRLTPASIAAFLHHSNADSARRAHRAKIFVMGVGGVGKTALIERLRKKEFFERPMTNGIDVVLWCPSTPNEAGRDSSEENPVISVWDFGGQEMYLNSHQLFMTDRSLNVVVWCGRERNQGDAVLWLSQLAMRVPKARVVVVATRCDEAMGDRLSRVYSTTPGLPDCVATLQVNPTQLRVSSKTGENMDELQTLLVRELQSLPLFDARYPPEWLTVADKLDGMREEYRHKGPVPVSKLDELARSCHVETGLLAQMIGTLHTWGVIVWYYRDEREFIIMNPQWLHDRFAEVVTVQPEARALLGDCHGIVREEALRELPGWSVLSSDEQTDVIELLQECELILKVFAEQTADGELKQRWVVPALLPTDKPEAFLAALWAPLDRGVDAQRVYRVQLSFLPEGLFSLLTVRLRGLCATDDRDSVQLLYHTGIVVHDRTSGTHAFVYIRSPYVYVDVRGRSPWVLGKDVLYTLEHLLRERFKGLTHSVFVHCIKCPCTVDEDITKYGFFSLDSVRKSLSKGKRSKECPMCNDEINLSELVTGGAVEYEHGQSIGENELLLRNQQQMMVALKDLRAKIGASLDVSERTASDMAEVKATTARIEALQAQVRNMMSCLQDQSLASLRLLLRGQSPTPRVLFLTAKASQCVDAVRVDTVNRVVRHIKKALARDYFLHVCCEFEGHVHCVREYKMRFNKPMLRKTLSVVSTVLKWAKPIAGVSAAAAAKSFTGGVGSFALGAAATSGSNMLCDALAAIVIDDKGSGALLEAADMLRESSASRMDIKSNETIGSETATDKEFEEMLISLDEKDKKSKLWGLNRCTWRDGRTVFLCDEHMKESRESLISNLFH